MRSSAFLESKSNLLCLLGLLALSALFLPTMTLLMMFLISSMSRSIWVAVWLSLYGEGLLGLLYEDPYCDWGEMLCHQGRGECVQIVWEEEELVLWGLPLPERFRCAMRRERRERWSGGLAGALFFIWLLGMSLLIFPFIARGLTVNHSG